MMDRYLAQLDALGATIVLTADHGMNAKHDTRRQAQRDLPAGRARRLDRQGRGARDPADHRSLRGAPRRARLVRAPSTCRRGHGPRRRRASASRRCAGIEIGAVTCRRPRSASSCRPTASATWWSSPSRTRVIGTSASAPRPVGAGRAAALARRRLGADGAADLSTARSTGIAGPARCATSTSSTSRLNLARDARARKTA